MSPFYVEDDSELASEIAFRILLHIRNKFGYTPYRLPVEIYIFWQNPSIIDFRKNSLPNLTLFVNLNRKERGYMCKNRFSRI
jgi:hypothetical protein